MQAKDLRESSNDELAVKERELRESLFVLKLRHGTNQLENPARLKETRRDLARIKTILRARQLEKKG